MKFALLRTQFYLSSIQLYPSIALRRGSSLHSQSKHVLLVQSTYFSTILFAKRIKHSSFNYWGGVVCKVVTQIYSAFWLLTAGKLYKLSQQSALHHTGGGKSHKMNLLKTTKYLSCLPQVVCGLGSGPFNSSVFSGLLTYRS